MVGDIGQTIDFGINQYRVLYELGKGAQGKVFCVERVSTKECFAMKVCKPSGSSLNEIRIQRNCYCPNIVTIV
jgi:serine/threonine protein kinase